MSDEIREGISRRNVLKRAAVVGAVAWTAPVIQSINPTRAYAGTPQRFCYSVRINPDGTCFPEQNAQFYHCVSPNIGEVDGCAAVAASAVSDPVTGTMTVTIAGGCTLQSGASLCGGGGVPTGDAHG